MRDFRNILIFLKKLHKLGEESIADNIHMTHISKTSLVNEKQGLDGYYFF